MEISRSNVLDLVRKCGLNPDKDYGQNYLLETSVCERIVNALDINDEDTVLEIGPGIGSLTHFVCLNKKANINLVDIDQRMIDFLRIHYGEQENVTLTLCDIRKHDVLNYTKILGNLPYNITTETIMYLLKNATKCKKMVLMCQAEAFNHFFDVEGKEYGPSSILVHLLGDIKRVLTVKPGSFYPAPKCNSIVFEINMKENPDFAKASEVYEFSKKMFLNRRKTIYNNLVNYIKDSEKAKKILLESGIEVNTRPEQISFDNYQKLFRCYQNNL